MNDPHSRFPVPAWVLSSVATLAIVVGLATLDRQVVHWYSAPSATPTPAPTATAPPEPDRVVGVVEKCDPVDADAAQRVARYGCPNEAKILGALNHRLELTVRTSSGGSYVVTVPPTTPVSIGDTWPK